MMTRAEAIAEVSLFCDATAYPQLSTTEIGSALDSFERFSIWTAATAYAVGDRVVPVVPTGRVYECQVAGTSGASEPNFPVYSGYQYRGWSTEDGTSDPVLLWTDAGPANVERYDTRMVARQMWLIKASRVVGEIDAKEGASDVKLSQLKAHCLEMANRYRPLVIV